MEVSGEKLPFGVNAAASQSPAPKNPVDPPARGLARLFLRGVSRGVLPDDSRGVLRDDSDGPADLLAALPGVFPGVASAPEAVCAAFEERRGNTDVEPVGVNREQ